MSSVPFTFVPLSVKARYLPLCASLTPEELEMEKSRTCTSQITASVWFFTSWWESLFQPSGSVVERSTTIERSPLTPVAME